MGLNLLVIDDSLTVRKLVEIAFKGSDAAVTFAVNGADGITKAKAASPQVILLDHILPDMRALDVCRQLSEDPRLARVPVVLMSAKHLDVRSQFAAFPAVVDFVAKPFTREEIARRLRQASPPAPAPAPAAPAAGPEVFSFAEKQAAARILFEHLKEPFGQIPFLSRQLGDAPTAAQVAKKILTADVMERMLAELAPFVLETATAGSTRILGQLGGEEMMDLLRMLESGDRTGTMTLKHPGAHLIVYWKSGAILLASCFDPGDYQRDSDVSFAGVSPEARAEAENMQRQSGKPVYATLTEMGHLSSADAQRAMARQGRRLLRRALHEPSCRFEWSAATALPPFLSSLGQSIPVTQLWLERRRGTGPSKGTERIVPSLLAIFERAERFSAKVRQLELTGDERRVLALVDGRAGIQEIVERSGRAAHEVIDIVCRLAEVGLLRRRASLTVRPKVLVLEPDVEGFQRPLAALLAGLPRAAELVVIDKVGDVVAAAKRDRPALILINVSAAGSSHAENVARALSALPDVPATIVAILEPGSSTGELADGALFDAILAKPVHTSEIERLFPN